MKKILVILSLFIVTEANAQIQVPLNNATFKIPFVAISSTDHITEKTDVSSVTCRRSKNGVDGACSGSSAELSDANNPGQWEYSLAAGDTDTAGPVSFRFSATGMDSTRAIIQVAVGVNINTGGITPSSFTGKGTLQSATSTTAVLASTENWADNVLANGYALYINTASTNAGVYGCITANVQSTDTVTVTWPGGQYPTGTITYDIIPEKACNSIQDKTGFSLASSQTFNNTGSWTGNISGSVGSVTGNVGGSVASVTGAVGSVTSIGDTTVTGNITAIKAKTDQLAFTTAGHVNSRINYVGVNAVSSPSDFTISVADILNANIENWPTGLGKYIDTIKKYVANRLVVNSNAYTIYKDDGLTTFQTGATAAGSRTPNP